MKKNLSLVVGLTIIIVIILIACSGKLGDIIAFFAWLFMLNHLKPEISIFGEIAIRIVTVAVSYSVVGLAFDYIGLYNSRFMTILYFVVSTILSFVLAWVIWFFEEYRLAIGVAFCAISILAIGSITFFNIFKRRKENQ